MLGNIPFDYCFPLAVLGDFGLVGLFPNHSHAGGEPGGPCFAFHNPCDLINSAVC